MLIYQSIEELRSVLYHCNTLTINYDHNSDESHDQSKLTTSSFPYRELIFIYRSCIYSNKH